MDKSHSGPCGAARKESPFVPDQAILPPQKENPAAAGFRD
jgi:hypothetical protein